MLPQAYALPAAATALSGFGAVLAPFAVIAAIAVFAAFAFLVAGAIVHAPTAGLCLGTGAWKVEDTIGTGAWKVEDTIVTEPSEVDRRLVA